MRKANPAGVELGHFLKAPLRALSLPYRAAIGLYNQAYETGSFPQAKLPVPVISVGNISVGGTGKTPLVEYLASWLSEQGARVVILSRGYHAPGPDRVRSDESVMLHHNLPGVPHITGRNRYLSGLKGLRDFGADVFVLDDGFQYRPLFRDLDIITISALKPFTHDKLLPAGCLREPPAVLKRAQVAVISHTDMCDEKSLQTMESTLRSINENLTVARTCHQPTSLDRIAGKSSYSPRWLRRRKVVGFSGIGTPESFRRLLEKLEADLIDFFSFPDHHYYCRSELQQLAKLAAAVDADALVTTQKDAVRLEAGTQLQPPVLALRIACKFASGEVELHRRIRESLNKKAP